MAFPRPVLMTTALFGLALLGGYCGAWAMDKNGFGAAIFAHFVDPPHRGFPGAPQPVLRAYTGVGVVDGLLAVLVAYFSGLLDGDVAPPYRLYAAWGMAQFGACWTLVALEGLRAGNRGRVVSWVGTMGLMYQTCSWTVTVPLWLILHLLTSPVAQLSAPTSRVSSSALLVDNLWDLAVLPLTVVLTYIIPTIAMFLPPSIVSAASHYALVAFWQPFPLWHAIVHFSLSRVGRAVRGSVPTKDGQGRVDTASEAYRVRVKDVYGFVKLLAITVHLPIMLLALAPVPVLSSLGAIAPNGLQPYLDPSVTLSSIFVPRSPFSPPTVDPESFGSGDLAPLAVFFLHYDMYLGCGALLLWATYLHRKALGEASFPLMLVKAAGWFAVGGFAAAAAVVLEDRDSVAVESEKKTT